MTEHWVYQRWFLRGVAERLTWGEDADYDDRILAELAEIAGEPVEKIKTAVIKLAVREYCAVRLEGNDTVH